MSRHKGKPSGKFAESKSSPGRKGDYKRIGWPEEHERDEDMTASRRMQRNRRGEEAQ